MRKVIIKRIALLCLIVLGANVMSYCTHNNDIAICESVLRECQQQGILSTENMRYAKHISHYTCESAKLSAYMDLISECQTDSDFYDTIGSGNAYYQYVQITTNK